MKARVFKQIVLNCKMCPAAIKPDAYCKDYFCSLLREKIYDTNTIHKLCRLPVDEDEKEKDK